MAGTGKKLWDNRDSGLRYEEHLNGSPLVIQHTISIFTLRVKVKRRWTYLFYKKAADAAGCLSQSSPLSLHSRAWQTLKNVARKKKKRSCARSATRTGHANTRLLFATVSMTFVTTHATRGYCERAAVHLNVDTEAWTREVEHHRNNRLQHYNASYRYNNHLSFFVLHSPTIVLTKKKKK